MHYNDECPHGVHYNDECLHGVHYDDECLHGLHYDDVIDEGALLCESTAPLLSYLTRLFD